MSENYPLIDVTIMSGSVPDMVTDLKYCSDGFCANQEELIIRLPGVGRFYVYGGREVRYTLEEDADNDWLKLYLNGLILVALLHQRKIINFHASSFMYGGRGVMILGETGAGKSSVTLAFALYARDNQEVSVSVNGGFLTDDITPVVFEGPVPCIMPLNRKVKVRHDTAEELGISTESLTEAERGTGKKYLSIAPVQMNPYPLNVIVKIETDAVDRPAFSIPSPAERFSLLRSEVCSWEILAGMPETEREYLRQIIAILEYTKFIRVVRPPDIGVKEFYLTVREAIDKLPGIRKR